MIKFVLFLFLLNFFNAGLMGPDKKKEKKYKMTKPKIVEVPNLEWGGKVAEDNWSNLFFQQMPVDQEDEYTDENVTGSTPNFYTQNYPLYQPGLFATRGQKKLRII